MALAESDILLRKSANHPSDDTSTAGGAKTATTITNGSVGEWFTRLRAKLSGVIDAPADVSKEYQKVFVENISGADSLLDGLIYVLNGMKIPPSSGLISFEPSNAADDNTKKIISYVENGSNLFDTDSVTLNGLTPVSGAVTSIRAFRCKLCLVSNDALTPAAGDIVIKINGNVVGKIPQGYSFATSEVKLWVVSTTDDTGTSTNRKTAPGGSTFTLAVDSASAISIRNNPSSDTLAFGEAQGVWGELTLQPGSPAFNGVEVVLAIDGDGT